MIEDVRQQRAFVPVMHFLPSPFLSRRESVKPGRHLPLQAGALPSQTRAFSCCQALQRLRIRFRVLQRLGFQRLGFQCLGFQRLGCQLTAERDRCCWVDRPRPRRGLLAASWVPTPARSSDWRMPSPQCLPTLRKIVQQPTSSCLSPCNSFVHPVVVLSQRVLDYRAPGALSKHLARNHDRSNRTLWPNEVSPGGVDWAPVCTLSDISRPWLGKTYAEVLPLPAAVVGGFTRPSRGARSRLVASRECCRAVLELVAHKRPAPRASIGA